MRFICALLLAGVTIVGGGLARTAYSQAPQNPEIVAQRLLVRGMTQSFLGDDAGALEFFNQILQFKPDDPTVQAAIAATLVRLEDFTRASFYAERAATLAPDRPENIRLVAELRRLSGDVIGSLEAYDGLITLLPKDLGARVAKARLLTALEQRSAARETYAQALALGARPAVLLREYLKVLIELGELESALETARSLQSLSGDIEVARTVGQLLVRLSRDLDAANQFAAVLDQWPDDREAYDALMAIDAHRAAEYRTRAGSPMDVAAALARDAERDVRSIDLRLRALRANLQVRDSKMAIRLAEDGALFFPGNRALIKLAVAAFLHGLEPAKALDVLRDAERLDDENEDWEALVQAGRGAARWVLTGVSEPSGVTATGAWAILAAGSGTISRESPLSSLARALEEARDNRVSQAINILSESAATMGASPLEWLVQGDLLSQAGRHEEAASAWRQALELAPANAIAMSRLQLP